jgi:hypothetical protein
VRIPESVIVGPHEYKVVMVPDGVLVDASQAGHCSPLRLVIAIDVGQEPSQMADTLLHELTHAMLATLDLGDDEERVALVLGPALLSLLRANPGLVAYVTGPL